MDKLTLKLIKSKELEESLELIIIMEAHLLKDGVRLLKGNLSTMN